MSLLMLALLTVVSIGVSLVVVAPLVRSRRPASAEDRQAWDREVYKDQLGEIYADRASGRISEAEAEAARIEISRRLLTASEESPSRKAPPPSQGRGPDSFGPLFALGSIAFICLGAFGLYVGLLGQPAMPDAPWSDRLAQAREKAGDETLQKKLAAARKAVETDTFNAGLRMSLAFLLKEAGKAGEARYQAAEAVRLAPEDPEILSDSVFLSVLLDEDTVSKDTCETALAALRVDRSLMVPRLFLGLAREQAGEFADAIAIWKDLRAELPDDTELAINLDQRIRDVATRGDLSVSSVVPRHPLDYTLESWAALPLPSGPADTEADPDIAGAPDTASRPEARADGPAAPSASKATGAPTLNRHLTPMEQAMMEAMAEAGRIKVQESPRDFAAWMQVARSLRVLGDYDGALEAYRGGLDIHPRDMEARRGAALCLAEKAAESGAEAPLTKEALDLMRGIIAENPQDAEILFYLGVDAALNGRTEDARTLLSQVLVLTQAGSPLRAGALQQLNALPAE